jgi:hypothetical protein
MKQRKFTFYLLALGLLFGMSSVLRAADFTLTDSKGKPLPEAPKIEGLSEGEAINGRAREDDVDREAIDDAA